MIGIGGKLQKQTKMKILAERARQHNEKYNNMLNSGVQPQDAMRSLTQEQFQRRHQQQETVEQPYKTSNKINHLGGSVSLGYNETYKNKSTTKAMMETMQGAMKAKKQGTFLGQSSFNLTKSPQEIQQLKKMKDRIRLDHLAEDKKIDLGEKPVSDYKRNFIDDEKMADICKNKDMKFNQKKNDLKWYAQTYIKTKQSLRK